MTHYHNNYALVQCIDPTTYKVRQEDPQQLEVDGEWIDLLPFWRWECLGIADSLNISQREILLDGFAETTVFEGVEINEHINRLQGNLHDLLRSLNLDPARCLVFKQMEK